MSTIRFIDRECELSVVEKALQSDRAEFLILYGRRRVGKTELLKHLLGGRENAVYFLGRNEAPHHMIVRLSRIISEKMNDERVSRFPFRNMEEALEYIAERNLIVAFDEFPYMVATDPSLPSILQDHWDNRLRETKVKLILCGSSVSMMERHLINYSSPLYGRRTRQLKLEPLQFMDLPAFFPGMGVEKLVDIYAVLGGTPAYLMESEEDIFTIIRERILKKEEFLYRDAEFVLREEFREPRYYFSILRAIASGRTTLSKIMDDSGLSRDVASKYLGVLIDLGIIHRSVPLTEGPRSRKGIYKLRDNYFRFWFRFVFPNFEYIEMGETDYVIEKIREGFPQYLGGVFEEVVVEVFTRTRGVGVFPFAPTRIGRWWDRGEEIDVIAQNERTGDIIYGEIKYTGRKVGKNILEELMEKAENVKIKKKDREFFLLISKGGFTKNLLKEKRNDVILLGMNDFEKHVFSRI